MNKGFKLHFLREQEGKFCPKSLKCVSIDGLSSSDSTQVTVLNVLDQFRNCLYLDSVMGPTPVSFSTVFKESYRSIDLAFQSSKSVVGEELGLSHNSLHRPPLFGGQWCPTLQGTASHSNSFFVPSLEASQNLNRQLGNARMTVRSLCISVEIQQEKSLVSPYREIVKWPVTLFSSGCMV